MRSSDRRADGGMVTAELAACLPVLVLLLAFVVSVATVGSAAVRAQDAAREAARAAARGDDAAAARLAHDAAPGAAVSISSDGDGGDRGGRGAPAPARAVAARGHRHRPRSGCRRTEGAAVKRRGGTGRPATAARPRSGCWRCVLLVMAVLTVTLVRAVAVLGRHRAESAADLAALAAAGRIGMSGSPCAAAEVLAGNNGARLVSCDLRLDAGRALGDGPRAGAGRRNDSGPRSAVNDRECPGGPTARRPANVIRSRRRSCGMLLHAQHWPVTLGPA